ncbi:MAG: DUF2058 family protein [Deltaproteobacteria bacterium]|nr:DUF2058 family protein [Deltaproteobacteria bacterium]
MQNLRDKLLKAKAVGKKQARAAKTAARREKKQAGSPVGDAEELQRRQAYEAKLREEAAAARALQTERNAAEQRRAHQERVNNIIARHALPEIEQGEQRFFIVGPDKRLCRLYTSPRIVAQLSDGQLAAVAAPFDGRRAFRLIDAETAARIEALAPERLLFWNKDGGDDPAYG